MKPAGQIPDHIQLRDMPQLAEAINRDDDWTGLTDATLRRKRQNRLNVRAYRGSILNPGPDHNIDFILGRRKAQQSRTVSKRTSASVTGCETQVPCWDEAQQAIIHLPIGSVTNTIFDKRTPLVPTYLKPHKFSRIIFPLSSDHFITLLQFNVLRGSLANHELLSRFEPSATPHQECSDAALYVSPDSDAATLQSLPQSLHPTVLQRTVPHEGWIDIIPHPRLRDNCIRAIGTFDEDQLWSDTIGGLFEGFPDSEVEHRGVLIWSTPWSTSGWELSEGFWRRWGWLLGGCMDILDATNHWRRKRGEEPLTFEIAE